MYNYNSLAVFAIMAVAMLAISVYGHPPTKSQSKNQERDGEYYHRDKDHHHDEDHHCEEHHDKDHHGGDHHGWGHHGGEHHGWGHHGGDHHGWEHHGGDHHGWEHHGGDHHGWGHHGGDRYHGEGSYHGGSGMKKKIENTKPTPPTSTPCPSTPSPTTPSPTYPLPTSTEAVEEEIKNIEEETVNSGENKDSIDENSGVQITNEDTTQIEYLTTVPPTVHEYVTHHDPHHDKIMDVDRRSLKVKPDC